MKFLITYVKTSSIAFPKSPLLDKGASDISQIARCTQALPSSPKLKKICFTIDFHVIFQYLKTYLSKKPSMYS